MEMEMEMERFPGERRSIERKGWLWQALVSWIGMASQNQQKATMKRRERGEGTPARDKIYLSLGLTDAFHYSPWNFEIVIFIYYYYYFAEIFIL